MSTSYKFESVAVAVDFSKNSQAVLKQARLVAKSLKKPLSILHAIDNSHIAHIWDAAYFEKIKHEVQKKIDGFYRLQPNEKIVVLNGSPAEQISKTIKKMKKPLLFIGHNEKESRLTRLFLGSTAETLAENSRCPVWIHKTNSAKLPGKIMVASDFSKRTQRTLNVIKNMHLPKAKIEVQHVMQPAVPLLDYSAWQIVSAEMQVANNKSLEKLRREVAPVPVKDHVSIDAARALVKIGKKYDLVCITPHKEGELILGFDRTTTKLVRESPTSVFIIPAN